MKKVREKSLDSVKNKFWPITLILHSFSENALCRCVAIIDTHFKRNFSALSLNDTKIQALCCSSPVSPRVL